MADLSLLSEGVTAVATPPFRQFVCVLIGVHLWLCCIVTA